MAAGVRVEERVVEMRDGMEELVPSLLRDLVSLADRPPPVDDHLRLEPEPVTHPANADRADPFDPGDAFEDPLGPRRDRRIGAVEDPLEDLALEQ